MKSRCVKADHNLLTPDTQTLSGVRLVQVRSEGVASSSVNVSDSSSSSESRRRPLIATSTRRLRFEDETETEAESRYLERQRRRAGQVCTGVLLSKPDLNLYIRTRPQGAESVDRKQKGRATGRGSEVQLNLRTEPIRETYIGSVTPAETSRGGGGGSIRVMRTHRKDLNENQVTLRQPPPLTDLPINPYAPDQLTTPSLNYPVSTSPPPTVTSAVMPQSIRLTRTEVGQYQNQDQDQDQDQTSPQGNLSSSSSSSSVENQAPPPPGNDGQVRQPMRLEPHRAFTSPPEHFSSLVRHQSSRLSLRRLFSDTLSLKPPCAPSPRGSSPCGSSPRGSSPFCSSPVWLRKSPAPLKKTPSLQSLSGQGASSSTLFPLRKSSSLQSLMLEKKKKKKDRPADERLTQY